MLKICSKKDSINILLCYSNYNCKSHKEVLLFTIYVVNTSAVALDQPIMLASY